MKTLVRVQEGQDNTKLGLGFMTIQILVYPYNNSDTINVIGHISFQRNLGGSIGGGDWYAMRFNVETDSVEELQKMTSLLRAIKNSPDYSHDSQPDDILKIIGAVKYGIFKHEFVPLNKEGENFYDVMSKGSVYTRVVAPDEEAAQKILKKRKLKEMSLKLNAVVTF